MPMSMETLVEIDHFSYFCLCGIKGAVSRYSVIFCAFLREQKWRLLAQVSRTVRLESSAVRAAWQPGHLRWLLTWQCRAPTTNRARVALLHLSTATGSTFVFRLRGPSKVISPPSRFKISSDSDIDSLFWHVWFCAPSEACFGDLVAESMGDWEKESAVWS